MTPIELLFTIAAGVVVGGVFLFLLGAVIQIFENSLEPGAGFFLAALLLALGGAAYWFFILK